MAVYWSWAFGNETAAQLNDEMGFSLNNTDPNHAAPTTDANAVYSYPGSPTRYSLDLSRGTELDTPAGIFLAEGWVATPSRTFQGLDSNLDHVILGAYGNNQEAAIYCSDEGASELSLRLTRVGISTSYHVLGNYPDGDWRYFAMKYNLAGTVANAEVWIDGSLIVSATASWSGGTPDVDGQGLYKFGGIGNSGVLSSLNAPLAQIIIYDTGSLSSGYPYEPRFVTRVEPTIDITGSGVGTFTPSTGADNFAVLDSPFTTGSFTANTSSNVGDRVVCEASGASGFYSQLGTTPTDIRGITLHGWASGSGQQGFVGISDNDSTYGTGSHITPDLNDPTYGYVTAADRPSDAAAWNTGSLLYVKYEVS